MYVNAVLQVYFNDKLFDSVVSIDVKNDAAHIGATCDIVVPLNSRLKYQNVGKDYITDPSPNNYLFNSGDTVTVLAVYEGYKDWVNVFDGYVNDFTEGTPLTVKCLDAVYLLNQSTINLEYKKPTPLKNIINDILKGTGIVQIGIEKNYTTENGTSMTNPVFDLELENLTFKNMSPAACLEYIKTNIGLNITLMGKQLYVNIASNTTNTVKLDTRINVCKSDLQKPNSTFQKFKVKAWFIREDSTRDSFEVGDENGALREVFFYNIPKTDYINISTKEGLKSIPRRYNELANEALKKVKQVRYSGTVEIYLYPFCDLFWRCEYKDLRYPEKNGVYVITALDYKLDGNGFHKTLKLAHLTDG
jgi:hypothetical protein